MQSQAEGSPRPPTPVHKGKVMTLTNAADTTISVYSVKDKDGLYASKARLWHMINAADKYLFNASILKAFFDKWYRRNVNLTQMKDDFARQLALPCYVFDHAEAFAEITKWLVYSFAGHITDNRPRGFRWKHMHLAPPDFVRPMNHARGNLKTCLHRGIWNEIGTLLERGKDKCKCRRWAITPGYYFASLVETTAYPLEKAWSRSSVNEILTSLKLFDIPEVDP